MLALSGRCLGDAKMGRGGMVFVHGVHWVDHLNLLDNPTRLLCVHYT